MPSSRYRGFHTSAISSFQPRMTMAPRAHSGGSWLWALLACWVVRACWTCAFELLMNSLQAVRTSCGCSSTSSSFTLGQVAADRMSRELERARAAAEELPLPLSAPDVLAASCCRSCRASRSTASSTTSATCASPSCPGFADRVVLGVSGRITANWASTLAAARRASRAMAGMSSRRDHSRGVLFWSRVKTSVNLSFMRLMRVRAASRT
mmetsp:Transcript_6787/g.15023  ORF Transcript_6787/g.15023 Transcript_6787/m.15023 type:complete len:209 (+) Transcript_6787:752-1378(+)